MAAVSRTNLATFSNSPYAAELQSGGADRSFSPPIEAEYLRARLRDERTLIRAAAVLGVLVTCLRSTERVLLGTFDPVTLTMIGAVVTSSIVLAGHLPRVCRQGSDEARPLAILMLDIDHFKAYNDRHGHQAGDQAMRRVAQALQTFVTRPLDVLARYGGEEFAVILYDVDAREADGLAER